MPSRNKQMHTDKIFNKNCNYKIRVYHPDLYFAKKGSDLLMQNYDNENFPLL